MNFGIALLAALLPAACRSTPPVVKVGLSAPFEGLYRETGYAALDALRAALADYPMTERGVLPLALDDHALPERAARTAAKLTLDPGVAAIIGPLAPEQVVHAAPHINPHAAYWIAPYAIDPAGGFDDPNKASAWAEGLLAAVANHAVEQDRQRLVLAGWTPGWPDLSAAEWEARLSLPVVLLDEPDGMELDELAEILGPTDLVVWLGMPDKAAALLEAVRQVQPDVPFWLAGPVDGVHLLMERVPQGAPVFWAVWGDAEYNEWSANRAQAAPGAYLVYRAAIAALARVAGIPLVDEPQWKVMFFRIDVNGVLIPWSPS